MQNIIPKYQQVVNKIKKDIEDCTIADKLPSERMLAKELGVSYMTVRKALDKLLNENVIIKIPHKGSFVNTQPAQKNRIIGYFLDSSIRSGIASPYYSLLFQELERWAAKKNYALVFFSDADKDRLDKLLPTLDGVIATCIPSTEDIILEINQYLPVVVIENSTVDKTIPAVVIDNFNADSEAVNYIVSLGHSHIGCMTGLFDSKVGTNRFKGFEYGLKHNNLVANKEYIFHGDYSHESGIKGAKYFLSLPTPPTAIICANDSMALGAIKEFQNNGVRVPEDMSIIGFDDISIAAQSNPALTTVRAPIQKIAKYSCDLLFNKINNKENDYSLIALSTQLIVRESCAPVVK